MVAIIALVIWALTLINHAPVIATVVIDMINEEQEWAEYHADAYEEYADEFTAIFNSLSTKRAKNGALMISRDGKNYRFAKKG